MFVEGVITPAKYINQKGGRCAKNYSGIIRIWTLVSLNNILHDIAYCGTTVGGKSRTQGPRNPKKIRVPKEIIGKQIEAVGRLQEVQDE